MTRIEIIRFNGSITGFTAREHTGFAPEGSDIVCSAISALTQSAVLGLEEVAKVSPQYSIGDGELSCSVAKDLDPGARLRADMVLETMLMGLRSIKVNYGEYLNIAEREV